MSHLIFTTNLQDESVDFTKVREFSSIACVYFIDLKRIIKVKESFVSELVAINKGVISDLAASFGYCKQSELGCEDGFVGIKSFYKPHTLACIFRRYNPTPRSNIY